MRAGIRIVRRAVGGRAGAFALTLGSSGAALAVALALVPIGGDDSIPGLLFLGAVGLSGWYGGLGPALLATACGALALDYFFEVPPYALEVTNSQTLAYLVSFLLVSLLLGTLNARLRASNRRLVAERSRAGRRLCAR